jgi:hypothetical protein
MMNPSNKKILSSAVMLWKLPTTDQTWDKLNGWLLDSIVAESAFGLSTMQQHNL